VGSPVRLDRERADTELPPPGLGEHTADVLAALGLASEEVERLRAAKAIA
jgi:crotonobetainyl-CoA:carnitine CoA-transferase CaiB-like acyl-CoA transferase